MLSVVAKRSFASKHLSKFATIDPFAAKIGKGANFVNGEWGQSEKTHDLVDPLTGKGMHVQPDL